MPHKYIFSLMIIILSAFFLTISCTLPKQTGQTPHWAYGGSGTVDDGGRKFFQSVGSASGIKNPTLLRTTADNRARDEMGKLLEVFADRLSKGFMDSASASDVSFLAVEDVEQALGALSKSLLNHAVIVDHWEDPATGAFYSLCKMDLSTYITRVDTFNEVGGKLRDYIRTNAGRVHGAMAIR